MDNRKQERAGKARGKHFVAGLVASSLVAFAGGAVPQHSNAQVAQPVRPGAPALAPSALLAPHKANYRFTLTALDRATGIARIEGGLYVERDRTCLGTVETQQLLWTRTAYSDGRVREERTATGLEEDGRAGALTFETRRTLDARTEEVPGRPQLNYGTKLPDEARVDTFTGKVAFANSRNNTGGTVTFSYPPGWVMQVPAGTIFPGELTRMLLQMAVSGQSERSASLFDGTSTSALYRVVARNQRTYAPGEAVPESARAALAARPSTSFQIGYYPPGVADAQPEFVAHYRLFDNGVIGEVALDYGTHALKGDLILLDMLPEPNCGGDARVAAAVPPAAPRATTAAAQAPPPAQAGTAPAATPLALLPQAATPQIAAVEVSPAPVVTPPATQRTATQAAAPRAFVPEPVEPARRPLFSTVRVAFFQGFQAPAFDAAANDGPAEAGEAVIDNYNFCPTPGEFARMCQAGEEPEAFRDALVAHRRSAAAAAQPAAAPAPPPPTTPAPVLAAPPAPVATASPPAAPATATPPPAATSTAAPVTQGTAPRVLAPQGIAPASPATVTVAPSTGPGAPAATRTTTATVATPARTSTPSAPRTEAAIEAVTRPQSETRTAAPSARGTEPLAAAAETKKADAKVEAKTEARTAPAEAKLADPARSEPATRSERSEQRATREAERAPAARTEPVRSEAARTEPAKTEAKSETRAETREARAAEKDVKEAKAADAAPKAAKVEEKEAAKVEAKPEARTDAKAEAKAEAKAKDEPARAEKAKEEPKAEAKAAAREERAERVEKARDEVKERVAEAREARAEKNKGGGKKGNKGDSSS